MVGMMRIKNTYLLIFATALLSCHAFGEELPVFPVPIQPVIVDNVTNPIMNADDWQSPTAQPPNIQHPQQVNLLHIEELITIAITHKNWQALGGLLESYQATPSHDPILYQYAMGAMLRGQGKQKEAINAYRSILAKQSDLPYVKLDLALMLTEDKQFKEADQLLSELEQSGKLTLNAHNIVSDFRKSIAKHQAPKPTFSVNYEATDNVNNASSTQAIEWLGRQWQKNEDSLPKSAHGIRYTLGISKQTNLTGNHNLILDADGDGVSYWDNPAYNEKSLKLSIGYKYQDIDHSVSILPFSEQTWLDGEKYTQNTGINIQNTYAHTPKSQLQSYGSLTRKTYENERLARRYNGNVITLGTSINHFLSRQTMVFGGVDVSIDNTKDLSLASNRYGIRVGATRSFHNGLGISANARYAYRKFKEPDTLVYNFTRKDDEYQLGLRLWHQKIAWQGLRPELNFRYAKVDSNMPAFYSRSGFSSFVNIQKDF